ncbi:MAG: dihydroorotate dehydrogenase [Firmicutes bacterium]|nr:dihydroorotate dehydrogenase [Bacillota bacterium]
MVNMADLRVRLGPLTLKNPVMAAAGTFGFGAEYAPFFAPEKLGALVVNGLTLRPREGNPPPRLAETPAGMLNAIGLQNPGLKIFLEEELPRLKSGRVAVIVNIAGESEEEYVILARELSAVPGIIALEINLSCPNVKQGGLQFGTSAAAIAKLVSKVRQACALPLIVKLTPNVTDISELARAAESGGADILSLVNTLMGMVIDVDTGRPFLGNITGGLSGPAIRPVAVRMVYEVYRATGLPLIGMGGIMEVDDALQFMMAGARAVAVGTANFIDPYTVPRLISALDVYLDAKGFNGPENIIGAAHR